MGLTIEGVPLHVPEEHRQLPSSLDARIAALHERLGPLLVPTMPLGGCSAGWTRSR